VFTRACHQTLPWAKWIQFISQNPISSRSTLALSCHLCLGHTGCLFASSFLIKLCISCKLHALPHTSHPLWFDHLTNISVITEIGMYSQQHVKTISTKLSSVASASIKELLSPWPLCIWWGEGIYLWNSNTHKTD